MAGMDYCKCEVCGKRLFYDADLPHDEVACIMALCQECGKEWSIRVIKKLKIDYKDVKFNAGEE